MHDWLPLPVFYSYHFISNLFELFLYLFPLAHFSHIHPLDFCYVSAVLFLIFLPTLPLFLWWFYFTLLFLSWASSLFTYHLFSEFLYFSVALTLQRDIYFLKVLFCFIFKFMAQCSRTIFVSFMATLFSLVLFSHDLSLPSFWFSSSLPRIFLVTFFKKTLGLVLFCIIVVTLVLFFCTSCLLEIHVGKEPETCSRIIALSLLIKDFVCIFICSLHFLSQWTWQLWQFS